MAERKAKEERDRVYRTEWVKGPQVTLTCAGPLPPPRANLAAPLLSWPAKRVEAAEERQRATVERKEAEDAKEDAKKKYQKAESDKKEARPRLSSP